MHLDALDGLGFGSAAKSHFHYDVMTHSFTAFTGVFHLSLNSFDSESLTTIIIGPASGEVLGACSRSFKIFSYSFCSSGCFCIRTEGRINLCKGRSTFPNLRSILAPNPLTGRFCPYSETADHVQSQESQDRLCQLDKQRKKLEGPPRGHKLKGRNVVRMISRRGSPSRSFHTIRSPGSSPLISHAKFPSFRGL